MTDKNAIIEGQDSSLDKKYKLWRIRAFLGTWLAYAGFYICRKTIAVAQPEYMKEFSWTEMDIGIILSGYLWAYAIGQFVNGVLGDKVGTRRMFAIGLSITILMNLLFGFSFTILLMFFVWTINGYAQSCGWPSAVKGMSNWFSVRERGKIMGPWGTCYTVGDVVGTGLAAIVITVLVVFVFLLFRNKPEDVGLPAILLPCLPWLAFSAQYPPAIFRMFSFAPGGLRSV